MSAGGIWMNVTGNLIYIEANIVITWIRFILLITIRLVITFIMFGFKIKIEVFLVSISWLNILSLNSFKYYTNKLYFDFPFKICFQTKF